MSKKRKLNSRKVRYQREEEITDVLYGQALVPDWWDKLDEHQAKYASAIDYHKVIMTDSPAGTGKTTIAVAQALKQLKEGKIDKIMYVRFPDKRILKLGFLPGDEIDKTRQLMRPFYEAMGECGLMPDVVDALVQEEVVEMTTDIHERGTNRKRTFIIIDEAQNGDIPSLQLMLTRPHDSCTIVVCGHSEQQDNNLKRYGSKKYIPFEVYQIHMVKKKWAVNCHLKQDYRGEISRWADRIWDTVRQLEEECV